MNELQTKISQTRTIFESNDPAQIGALNREDLLGDMFQVGVLSYYAQKTVISHVIGLQLQASSLQLPSGGTYGYAPKVSYFFTFPRSIQTGGVEMDLKNTTTITSAWDGDAQKKFNMVRQNGFLGSALEHAVPEQMFVTPDTPGEAVSAVKLISKANAAGQRIYHITQANQDSTLPNLNLSADIMSDIQAGLNAGKEVITHTDNLTVSGYTGAGYIIFDPEVGDGAYIIGGGLNGGLLVLMAFLVLGLVGLAFGIGLLFAGSLIGVLTGIALSVSSALLIWGAGQGLGYNIVFAGLALIGVLLLPAYTLGLGAIVTTALVVEAALALATWIGFVITTTFTYGRR